MRLNRVEERGSCARNVAVGEVPPGHLAEDPRLLRPVADILERGERAAIEIERRGCVSACGCELREAAEGQREEADGLDVEAVIQTISKVANRIDGVVTEVGTVHNARVPIGELLFGVGIYEEPIGLLLDFTVARTLKFG